MRLLTHYATGETDASVTTAF
ncbi:hypothetical protein EmuJ_000889500 [Echinococcus multilocularis]|uniref:Uncharacterized protein n=1 Tax=Echinococcus multilocularis TaxID=6211 RepID=A0A068YFZ4_ECHMU|nr:hypothetical protein EmuJ_000889500 [Echinococcus multilocularis]